MTPTEWSHAKRYRDAAQMLGRIGAGRCIKCGARLRSDNRGRPCAAHEPRSPHAKNVARSDREAVTNLLNAVGDALGVE